MKEGSIMSKKVLRSCVECGIEFLGANNAKRCPDCRDRKPPKAERVCEDCGETFTGGAGARYCPACRSARMSQSARKAYRQLEENAAKGIMLTRICKDCGQEFRAATRMQLCPVCKENKAEEKRNRQTEKRHSLLRYCRACGIVITDSRHALYCPDCKAAGRKAQPSTGFCVICGVDMPEGQRKYCPDCKRLYNSAAARRLRESGQAPTESQIAEDPILKEARQRARRRVRLNGDKIALLAHEYQYPYNSYGRLKAYVDAHDALPEPKYLRPEIEYDGHAMPDCRWVVRRRETEGRG